MANGFGGFKGDAQELGFAPDSKTLARSITGNSTVRVWDVAAREGAAIIPLRLDSQPVECI